MTLGDTLADHPEIAREFDYERNGGLDPKTIPASHDEAKLWWVCENGHHWQAFVETRIRNLTGCRNCVHKRPTPTLDQLLDSAPPAFIAAEPYNDFSAEDELNAHEDMIQPELPAPSDPIAVVLAESEPEELWPALLRQVELEHEHLV